MSETGRCISRRGVGFTAFWLSALAGLAGAQEVVTVDFGVDHGPVTYRSSGFLHSLLDTTPANSLVVPLKPQLFRNGGEWDSASYARAKAMGARAQILVSDFYGSQAPWPGDNGDWTRWENLCVQLANNAAANNWTLEWDIWNEPNGSWSWGASWTQFLETWRRGVLKIRSVLPNATIVGPSLWQYDAGLLQGFLVYAQQNNVLPNIVSWHELSGYANIVSDVQGVKSYLQANGLSIGIELNEIVDQANDVVAGRNVHYLANVERAGVLGACHTCWGEPSGANNETFLDGALTTDGSWAPRSMWWVYRGYASMTGRLVNVVPSASVDGIAGQDSGALQAQVVLGRDGGAGSVQVSLINLNMVSYLTGGNQIHVIAQWVPNSGYSALANPTTVVDTVLAVSGTEVSLSLPNFGGSDAYLLTLEPAASQSPTLTSQPANLTVTEGQTATFSVTATGTAPLSYQWQESSDGGATWGAAGSNSPSFTTGSTATTDSGEEFRVIVSNPAGNITSAVAKLTVDPSGGGGGGGTTSGPVSIDSGGGAVGTFLADTDFSGGSTYTVTTTMDLSGVRNPAPLAVYQSERWGIFSYAIPGLSPGGTYTVRLHFAEIYFTTTGERIFGVAINGKEVLTNFDIVAAAGGPNKATIQQFMAQADSTGMITVDFLQGSANWPKSSGIEVLAGTGGGSSYRIDAGGPAIGAFVADTDFSGGSTYSTSATIDTSGVTLPAPQGVYQTERYGDFTYTIPNLSAGTPYLVRLHFAEIYWASAGQRIFNVSINGSPVLTNFDIVATAGAANKAIIKEYLATATSSGQISIGFSTVVNDAKVSGLELLKLVAAVNSGGASTGDFSADADFTGGTPYATLAAIDTSGVAAPAPQGVYQGERYGNFTYTIPNLNAGASYLVRLHFAEIYWTGAGQRIFNVSINGSPVLTNFDIFVSAGAANKAVIKEYLATANSSGQIALVFSTVVNDAKVSGIEVFDPPSGTPDIAREGLHSSSGGGACGTTGMEAPIILGLLALLRRPVQASTRSR